MMKKIAFVCQRYGLEVNGGSEMYCREVAERLSQYYDITVYTTCAAEYVTWANAYREGTGNINGVKVKRFRTEAERDPAFFSLLHKKMTENLNHTGQEEEEWLIQQGPYCPRLIKALKKEYRQYQAILFMTYMYYTTVKGLELNLDHTILIPTLHDEKAAYFKCYETVFQNARGIAWLTPEERRFANERFHQTAEKPSRMTGIGVDQSTVPLQNCPEILSNHDYIVYAGRIDEIKGCKELFRYFRYYKQRKKGKLKLVLMGKAAIPIPQEEDVIYLGFVDEEIKYAVMANALALVLFSPFESLSIVVLESMMMGKPVMVTEKCEVLKGHCIRSNAGLYFSNYYEFEAVLDYLRSHQKEYQALCANGIKYVRENYRWDDIINKYRELIDEV